MAKIGHVFNKDEVPEDEFTVLPEGEYTAQIIRSEMKETRSGTGMYLELRVQILDDPYTGRLVFDRLNLVNENDTAVKIAQRTLADICKALGLEESPEDSEELHGQEFTVVLTVEEETDSFPAQNRVKKYKAA